MKKILLIIIFGIFLFNVVSASGLGDNVTAYWDFDEGTGTVVNDSASNQGYQNGTAFGSPVWINGILGTGMNFSSSSSQYVNVSPDVLGLVSPENMSISLWIYPNSSTESMVILSKNINWLLYQSNLKLTLYTADSADGAYHNTFETTNSVLNVGKWQHVVIVYNGTGGATGATVEMYVNGTAMAVTKTYTHGNLINTAGQFNIGASDGTSTFFKGGLDEIAIWKNRTLNSVEVSELYNSGTGLGFSSFIGVFTINEETLPSSYYETETMNEGRFFINITNNSYQDLTATLVYNSTIFPTTRNTNDGFFTFERNITHSFANTNSIPFYWNFTLVNSSGTFFITYTNGVYAPSSQIVNPIVLALCNATYTTPYINFSFKDESSLDYINGTLQSSIFTYWIGNGDITKTYTYSTSGNFTNYSFCAYPDRTFYVTPYINYLLSGYPNRIYQPGNLTLISTVTNKILYLLSSTDGIYVTFITATEANTPISGASINILRTISGSNVTLASGVTDSAGSFTSWLNPNYDHYIIAGKTGYGATTQVIRPTQSTYTIILSSGINNYTFIDDKSGLKWFVFPSVGSRNISTATNFGFNISAQNDNLISCKIELLNDNKTIVFASAETITSNSSECSVYTTYSMNSTYPKVKGRLLIDIGDGYQLLEDDAYWAYLPFNSTGSTLTDWFKGLRSFDLTYFNNNEQHREYTQILLFFLLATIICAVMNSAGWDIQTNGGMIFLIGILIFVASIPGFLTLTGISPFSWMDKYFVALVYSMFMVGFTMRQYTA